MGGRRRLEGGFTPWLPDHRGQDGRAFRRYIRAGQEITGPMNGSALVRVDLARYGVAGVVYDRSARAWADVLARRESGRGRRPSERQLERAARRLGLADATLKEATTRLESLASQARPMDLAARVAQAHQERRRG